MRVGSVARRAVRDATPAQIAQIQRAALRVAKLRGKSKHDHALVLADMMEEANWPKDRNIVPTGRRGKPERWEIRDLDVWGNAEDGYEVNNEFRAGTIRIPTEEVLYNVKSYTDNFLAGYRATGSPSSVYGGAPLLRLISVDSHWRYKDSLWRALKKRYPKLSSKKFELDSWSSEGFYALQSRKDGKPALFLYQLADSR